MSETRDLGAPILVLLAGIGVLAWNLSADAGPLWSGGAGVVGVLGAAACLALTVRKQPMRALAAAFASILFLAALSPGFAGSRLALVPWGLAGVAVAAHVRRLPRGARLALLAAAAGLALLAAVALLSGRPGGPTAAAFAVAGALACAVNVVTTREKPVAAVPVGPVVGVFGGSFDPFHAGHRAICEAALEAVQRLLVVVSARPPHKTTREPSPFHHRVAMARIGVEGLPRTEVLEMEARREGPSYTVDTLDALRRLYPPGTRFRLVLGADSFQDFPLWHDWEGILDRADLLVAARPGYDLEPPPEFEGRNAPVERLAVEAVDASSTDLRRRVRAGEDVGDRLSPAVRAYVRDHALYLAATEPDAPEAPPSGASGPSGDAPRDGGAS